MKKLLILLFSILISFNSYGSYHSYSETICVVTDAEEKGGIIYLPSKTKPFTGKNLCKYENGQKKSEGNFKDGKRDGVYNSWYKNGQIKSERIYKEDEEIGKWTYWHENGQKEHEVNYKDGKLVRNIVR